MKKLAVLLSLLATAGCFGGDPSAGACKADSDCSQGSTCNTDLHVCQSACATACLASQLCVSGQCVAARCVPSCNGGQSCDLGQNPPVCQDVVTQVTAAINGAGFNGFFARTPEVDIPVTVVFRPATATQVASARVTANAVVVPGSTADGIVWRFAVPSTVQTPGSETPVAFTVSMTDSAGSTFSSDAPASAALRIDDAAPAVTALVIPGGVAGQDGNAWFKFDAAAKLSVQATIADQGSGLDPATLALRDVSTQARVDDGAPAVGADGAVVFHVPQSLIGAGQEGLVHFQVAAADHLGHTSAAPGIFGLDGKAPAITFAPGYPAAHAGCSTDANVFCGHDGAHFTRKDVATLSFAVSDAGAGVDPASGTCTVTGATGACTATFGSGAFSFPVDFSKLDVTTDAKGNATIALALGAKDLVGNGAADTGESVDMTRVKWVRATGIGSLAGAPIVSGQLGAVIVAGQNLGGDPIAAVDTSGGASLWTVGHGLSTPISQVTANMAIDTTPSTTTAHPTPMLYVGSGNTVYALHVSSSGVDKYCTGGLLAPMVGSPVLFSGGETGSAIVASGIQIEAVSPANLGAAGGSCAPVALTSLSSGGTHPTVGPPSANGSVIYAGYNNTANAPNDLGIASVNFADGTFSGAATANLGFQPTAFSKPARLTAPAGLFYGDDRGSRFVQSAPTLGIVNASPVLSAAQSVVAAPPVVSGGTVFGATNQLIAYDASSMAVQWTALPTTDVVTPPAIGDGALYTVQASTNLLHAIDTALHTDRWVYGGSGQTAPATTITAPTTEPTLAADGTLYFGDNGGRVYAIITDTPPAPFHPGDWPRTGFDNCNSNHANNPGYVCQ